MLNLSCKMKIFYLVTSFILIATINVSAKFYSVTRELNVRSGPGTQYAILGSIAKSAEVEINVAVGAWCKIKFRNADGYISTKFFVEVTQATTLNQNTKYQRIAYIIWSQHRWLIYLALLFVITTGMLLYRWLAYGPYECSQCGIHSDFPHNSTVCGRSPIFPHSHFWIKIKKNDARK